MFGLIIFDNHLTANIFSIIQLYFMNFAVKCNLRIRIGHPDKPSQESEVIINFRS